MMNFFAPCAQRSVSRYASSLYKNASIKASPCVLPSGLMYKQQPVFTAQRRKFGVGDYISGKIDDKKQEMQQHKERESFRHMRDYLISCPKYRFKESLAFVESLLAQIGKTDRLIGGADIKTQEETLKRKIAIFKALTPLELLQDSPAAINMAAKSRIGLATGIDRTVVTTELKQFDEMKMIHTWLHRRLKDGKTLPEHTVELQQLLKADPPPPTYTQLKFIEKQRQNARKPRYR